MAVERSKLQHLIFDNQVLWQHRALAAVLGAILRLPPVAKAMGPPTKSSRAIWRHWHYDFHDRGFR